MRTLIWKAGAGRSVEGVVARRRRAGCDFYCIWDDHPAAREPSTEDDYEDEKDSAGVPELSPVPEEWE